MPSEKTKSVPTTSDEAPRGGAPSSEKRSKVPSENTVCDFLYHDVRRIASFLSQFETYGVLQGVKATESVSRNQQLQTVLGAKGSLVVADASANLNQSTGDTEQDSAERTYDPLWLNARSFLSNLDQWGLIEEQIKDSKIGQFVQITGELSITDMQVAKSILSLPQVKEKLRKSNSHMDNKEIDVALAMFNTLPYAVQAAMKSDNVSVWGCLKEESLSVSPSDMFLKHGIIIQGEWKMLGILDAYPDKLTEEDAQEALNSTKSASTKLPFSSLVEKIAPMTRHLLGRPPEAFGITPLMIYREVYG